MGPWQISASNFQMFLISTIDIIESVLLQGIGRYIGNEEIEILIIHIFRLKCNFKVAHVTRIKTKVWFEEWYLLDITW